MCPPCLAAARRSRRFMGRQLSISSDHLNVGNTNASDIFRGGYQDPTGSGGSPNLAAVSIMELSGFSASFTPVGPRPALPRERGRVRVGAGADSGVWVTGGHGTALGPPPHRLAVAAAPELLGSGGFAAGARPRRTRRLGRHGDERPLPGGRGAADQPRPVAVARIRAAHGAAHGG